MRHVTVNGQWGVSYDPHCQSSLAKDGIFLSMTLCCCFAIVRACMCVCFKVCVCLGGNGRNSNGITRN